MKIKRLLNCSASDFASFDKLNLISSIAVSAGRTILAENDVQLDPMTKGITNAEYVAAFGTDLILLNLFDFGTCEIKGIDKTENCIKRLKELTGRPIGVNIEPVDIEAKTLELTKTISQGRIASEKNLKLANEMGFDFICLTGNPSTGVSNNEIEKSIKLAKKIYSGVIIAGKMHGAGVSEPVIDEQTITKFIDAGADIILIPVAGTIPGLSEAEMSSLVNYVHSKEKLVMGAIGTTQEGSDIGTIRELALTSKRAGCDIHHIGDGGYSGTADPENIMQLSISVRGKRHTFHRMALSINR
ncbi:haloacid dehalogenase-like hydrolase [Clostridium nigeriense]|uniref:DUF7916 family protein n=1 Tax=Clostridium nigeriense TaxID=1805470 RepID=UPI003D3483AA